MPDPTLVPPTKSMGPPLSAGPAARRCGQPRNPAALTPGGLPRSVMEARQASEVARLVQRYVVVHAHRLGERWRCSADGSCPASA